MESYVEALQKMVQWFQKSSSNAGAGPPGVYA